MHKTLIERGLTLATAESCTGGNIARLLTAQAGASTYFKGGVVAYSNEVKESALGVKHSTLEAHGAVPRSLLSTSQHLGTRAWARLTGVSS